MVDDLDDESAEQTDDEFSNTPTPEVTESINDKLLPEKSKERYKNIYINFTQWKNSKNFNTVTESILLEYFSELSQNSSPPYLWSIFSMLKSTLATIENINIGQYKNLTNFLKKQSQGYKGKKSKVLTSEQIKQFLTEAPDDSYLATKVALIFGICGACRREELSNVKVEDVEHHGNMILVHIPNTKSIIPRSFTIDGEFYKIVTKYESLRPQNLSCNRYFLNYNKGKCTTQPIGKNKFGKMPNNIASYLNLPDPSLYTGHSFRRTSATLLADSGGLKRHGGWKSNPFDQACFASNKSDKRKRHIIETSTNDVPPSTLSMSDPLANIEFVEIKSEFEATEAKIPKIEIKEELEEYPIEDYNDIPVKLRLHV